MNTTGLSAAELAGVVVTPPQQRARIITQGARQVAYAEDAFNAVKSIRIGLSGPVPAPVVYDLVSSLARTARELAVVLAHLEAGLAQSLTVPDLYQVYESDPGLDRFVQARLATDYLVDGCLFTEHLTASLHGVRQALQGQSYTAPAGEAEAQARGGER
jgi:hypothetical protein